ncbi:T9SS type A sorting domain-containing protein [Pseudoflavitalea sp. G-6-1-2]|uniref:right-handed parallel beta-helix repeat-containing protein n=1 Tax=Pseudoflavitalea sp. G-6-1-2 TaxID=2728841 RepID=UPI00146D90CA|nr:right-handed parallel beta-helix repeat-containing protein [Pseudoflavitalea sp. G-6-1-2]NML20947.1 T9SS type A sorting domain-containing protein [Pseudoflavitalea sp. G-6-1-2]
MNKTFTVPNPLNHFFLTVFICLLTLQARSQQNLYVDGTATGTSNGSSWINAYNKLSDALTAAAGGTTPVNIHVAKGTYYPAGFQSGINRDSAFTILRGGIRMYGGYPAGGGVRDIANNPVYLDGNINNNATNTDNSYHIMVIAGLVPAADSVIVDGFIFRNGHASGPGKKAYLGYDILQQYAGALMMQLNKNSGKIRVRNCGFSDNKAVNMGGAVQLSFSDASFENCSFSNNNVAVGSFGGAVFVGGSKSSFTNCNFSSNSSTRGGAIYNSDARVEITGSRFVSNSSDRGGAIVNTNISFVTISSTQFENNVVTVAGGAIYQEGGTILLTASQFLRNSAQYGGAIRNQLNPILSVKNSVFTGNTSSNTGAAMSLSEGSDTLVNNVFVLNKDNSTVGGGALCVTTGNFSIVNNTFYADTTTLGKGGAIRMEGNTGSVKLQNNIFFKCKGSIGNDVYNDAAMPYTATNNSFSIDPLFVNEPLPVGADNTWGTADDGLGLSAASSSANAGNITGVSSLLPSTDLSGGVRFFGGSIDLGAYESRVGPSRVLYVDSTSGNDANNGVSWAFAHKTLAHSLSIANMEGSVIDSILVAKGTYFPTGAPGATDRDSAFAILRSRIKLYGGYPAGGGVRDHLANKVILDGNINNPADSADNSYHVLVIVDPRNIFDSVVVDGFTIRNGVANGADSKVYKGLNVQRNSGAGVFTLMTGISAQPNLVRFINCTVTGNSSNGEGAGMYNNNSSLSISNCSFTINRTLVSGGGITNVSGASPVINYCIISDNSAVVSGAGMYNHSSDPVIKNSSIMNNIASGIGSGNGGGMYNFSNSAPQIDSCIISGNAAARNGGGIGSMGGSNPVIRNSSFIKNSAVNTGGAVYGLSESDPVLYNCTLSENTAQSGAGVYCFVGSDPTLIKCKFIRNIALGSGGAVGFANADFLKVDSCEFSDNEAKSGAGIFGGRITLLSIKSSRFVRNRVAVNGGALLVSNELNGVLEANEFKENHAQKGGAIYETGGNMNIRNCRFESNTADLSGGAIWYENGNFLINRTLFGRNQSQYGGALRHEGVNVILSVRNSIFESNESTNTGAALSMFQGKDTLVNNVFVSNKDNSVPGGGAVCAANGEYHIINNTFYGNSTKGNGGAIRFETAAGQARIQNNVFYKSVAVTPATSDIFNENGMPVVQSNNSFVDPAFKNEADVDGPDDKWGTADDGLMLTACSEGIDAGENSFLDVATVADIAGQPRIKLSKVDLGAYEADRVFSLNETNAALLADSYCGTDGWLNFYNSNEAKLLVAVKPGTNDLGVISATGNLRAGYGTNSTAVMSAPFGKSSNYYPFNRSFTITTSKTPTDSVGVRFYFASADSGDVKNTTSFDLLRDLVLYKVDGANAWNGTAAGYTGYVYSEKATKTTFTLGEYQGAQYAEFYVTSFSSGTMAVVQSAPLPLDLLSFSGQLINEKTKLQWLTANEVNLDRFDVERSSNNNNWKVIGQVNAKNTAGNQSYELWDNNPGSGWNYYRLKMVDIDSQYKYSKVVAVRTNGPALQVYPNPSNGQFTIQSDNAASELKMFDVNGRLVHSQRLVQGGNKINAGVLSRGVYVLKIEDGVKIYIERMIISK